MKQKQLTLFCLVVVLIVLIAILIFLATDVAMLQSSLQTLQHQIRNEADVEKVVQQEWNVAHSIPPLQPVKKKWSNFILPFVKMFLGPK